MPTGRYVEVKFVGGMLRQYMPITRIEEQATALRGVKRRALDLSIPFRAFAPRLFSEEARIFAAQGVPRWPALSPAYARWKADRFPGKTILRRSDRLYRSLTQPGGENILEITPRTIRFGSRVPYWIFHQTGTPRMPARPSVTMTSATFHELARQTLQYVARGGGVPRGGTR